MPNVFQRVSGPSLWAAAAAFLCAAMPRAAHARTCDPASDCPKGYACSPFGGYAWPDGGTESVCTSLPCQTNADCGPGLTCAPTYGIGPPGGQWPPGPDAGTWFVCSECTNGSGPEPGGGCPPGNICTVDTYCLPQWDGLCNTDGDCGPGFTCSSTLEEMYQCGPGQAAVVLEPYQTSATVPCGEVPCVAAPPDLMSGVGSGLCPGSGPVIPLSPVCEAGTTCLQITSKSCTAKPTGPCTTDSDCPSTWRCECFLCPQESPADAGCTPQCTPPNDDLTQANCVAVLAPIADASADGSSAVSGKGSSPQAGCSCNVGDTQSSAWTLWPLAVLACLGGARRRIERAAARNLL
jgi:MYXO-CTERM domain-containing protein